MKGSFIVVIEPSGQCYLMHMPKDVRDGLRTLNKIVGGSIETVPSLWKDMLLICNEEGKLNGLPKNNIATDLLRYDIFDVLVGTVACVIQEGDMLYGMTCRRADSLIRQITEARA